MPDFEFPFDPQEAANRFSAANELSSEINVQHTRAERTDEINDPDFRELALGGITADQEETFSQLRVLSDSAPYEQLPGVHKELNAEIGRAATHLETLREDLMPQFRYIDEQAELTIAVSPKDEARIRAMAEEKKARLDTEALDAEGSRLEDLNRKYDVLMRLYEQAGATWPVPQLIRRGETTAVAAQPSEDVTVDEIPVEPEDIERKPGRTFTKSVEIHIDAPEATKKIVQYLVDHPERVISANELAEFLYDHVEKGKFTTQQLRNRVTTLLAPHSHGERIRTLLGTHDMVLQYGIRTHLTDRGGKTVITGKTRIYRGLPADTDIIPSEEVASDAGYIDSFGETLVLGRNQKTAIPVKHEQQSVRAQVNPREAKEQKEAKADWQRALRRRVGEAIRILEKDGLMVEGETISARNASKKSSSNRIGTRTSVINLMNAGLMPKVSERFAESVDLTSRELVLMHILNNTPELSKRSKDVQRQAVEVVTNAVASYFDRRRDSQSR